MNRESERWERHVAALERIADALEKLATCVIADDTGHPAFRIAGEIIGGEGDVREGAVL